MKKENATIESNYDQILSLGRQLTERARHVQSRAAREQQHTEQKTKIADALAGASFVSDILLLDADAGYIGIVSQIALLIMATGLRPNEVLDMISDTISPPERR